MLFSKRYFLMSNILKVFIEFVVRSLLLFMFCFFGCKPCAILAPWPGIEFAPPELEGEVFTLGQQGKSQQCHCYLIFNARGYYIPWPPKQSLTCHLVHLIVSRLNSNSVYKRGHSTKVHHYCQCYYINSILLGFIYSW